MGYNFDAPFVWDENEDQQLLGSLFSGNLPQAGSSFFDNETNSPLSLEEYDSPFGESSLFADDKKPKCVPFVNFKRLIPDITYYQGAIMPYSYRYYENKPSIPVDFLTNIVEWLLPKEEGRDRRADPVGTVLRSSAGNTDQEYLDPSTGQLFFFDGILNTKEGHIKIDREHIGFSFTLDGAKREIAYRDHFHYTNLKTGLPEKEAAIIIRTENYNSYKTLSAAEGLYLSETSLANINNQFTRELATAAGKPNVIDWLYFRMPDFVLEQRDKKLLIADMATLLTAAVNETGQDYINEESIVLRIINAFATGIKEDHDQLLSSIYQRKVENETIFQALYRKMNDWGGANNFSALILVLYKIWAASSYIHAENYRHTGQPETLAYQNNRILGFYNNSFSFGFIGPDILARQEILQAVRSGNKEDPVRYKSTFVDHIYHPFQPILLPEIDQQGELKLPDTIIPAFYLKAFDDKAAWKNFEKTGWLLVDVITTFSAVGNLLRLRHLVHLTKGIYYLRLTTATVELASGIGGIMLNFVDNCKEGDFCDKLRKYLFWLDLATLGVDAITEKMIKSSAKEAFEAMPEKLQKREREVAEHLKEISELGRKTNLSGDITKSFFENAKIALRKEKPKGNIFGQSEEYTCVATSLKMTLDDLEIIRSENYLADALNTTINGANILDIPVALKNSYIDNIKTIVRGGKKDINVKFSTLQKTLSTKNKKAIVSLWLDDFGAHAIVVDKIKDGRVYLRDSLPLHQGSCYSVSIQDFEKVFNDKFVTLIK